MLIASIVLLILFIFRIFLGAAELSLSASSKIRLMQKADEGVKRAEDVLELTKKSSEFLPVILLFTLLADTGMASIAALVAVEVLPMGPAIAIGLVTLALFIFAEMVPKTFAVNNPERVAFLVVRPVIWLTRIFYPIAYIFILISNFFVKLLGGKIARRPFVTEEEIKMMVTMGAEEAEIEEDEKDMIHSIFEFGDTIVREVMVPRPDMIAVEKRAPLEEVLDLIIKVGHSRIPVYDESIDNVAGVIYAKDLLIYLNKAEPAKKAVVLKKMMRVPYFVPETKRVNELLKEMQLKKMHMAIVLDEYGGTAGLVTIEDLLEEIVGEIFDEYDLEETMVEVLSADSFRLDGRTPMDEVREVLGVDLPDYGGETIGGFVYDLVGHIPVPGESVQYENLRFEVEEIVARRILKIIVIREQPPETEETGKDE
ncbi:MAG: HlyC/CorC family transporter [Actinomycetia bacterium]|nr:HlyC/CorC family transporter [Actinomycetes bacterium]